MKRRRFLATSALAGSVAFTVPAASAAPEPPPGDVTGLLAAYLVGASLDSVPAAVRKEAARTLLNYTGCALGGARSDGVNRAVAAFTPFFGPPQAALIGRRERVDILHAALINGIASHILDYDDTHLKTVIHPAGPVASAILALSERQPVSGSDFLNAMILGIEVECRLGNAVYPAHYDRGWHITGTTGVFGAAAAAGKLLGLNKQQMVWALGLAATQPVGLREMFGTMTKSFHPGRAAQNGLTAALLAQQNFTSSDHGIEAKSGWANVVSTKQTWSEVTAGLGKTWEISLNTYKPFACGIVIHPTIDGCIQLRDQFRLTADQIRSIHLRVHPLVLELTGKTSPHTGLEGKFSVYHAAAVAIVEGAAGEQQFSDRAVQNPETIALRGRVSTVIDSSLAEDQVRITITLNDGKNFEKYIEHAVGSTKHPMTDTDLEAKFLGLAAGVISDSQTRRLLDLCWKIESLPDVLVLARATSTG